MKRTITSTSHELVKHWVRLQKDRSYRQTTGKLLVEGKNLLLDLVKRHHPCRLMITESHMDLFSDPGDTIIISPAIASKISGVQTPEGCFAEFELPQSEFPSTVTRALVLDGLQDPGNVGTLLRTALALNVTSIFLIEPCCDPWNPKTIRAGKGAQFDLTILSCGWESIPTKPALYVADTQGVDAQNTKPSQPWMLVLGNEAHGHKVPKSFHSHLLKIPMPGPVESLNVAQAGAILLYMLTRKPCN